MIKAIIFDMDGVIVDSEPLWYKTAEEHLKLFGRKLPRSRSFKRYVSTTLRGRTQQYVIKILRSKFGVTGSAKKIINDRVNILLKIFDKGLKAVPGALALINYLHQRNYKLLMASSSPRRVVNYVVKKYKLNKYFQKTVSGDDFQHSKPHPQIFLESAKLLREKPANVLVIEDSYSGIKAAKRAGMKCIGLKQPYTAYQYLKKADLVVKSLKGIDLKTIKELTTSH